MANRYPAVDSNALTYLLEAVAFGQYDPALDTSDLVEERVAMVRLFFFGDCSPWVAPTVQDEYEKIRDEERRSVHRRWTHFHFQDMPPDVSTVALDNRVSELLSHHPKEKDCRVVAEAEFCRGIDVLLTCDRDLLKIDGANIRILRPTEYWASLNITREPDVTVRPRYDNPLYNKTWWHFPA